MNPLAELIGDSPGITAVREQIGRLLQRQPDAHRLPPILIQGETGTGKGILARAIHRASARASGPFVDVNCAAIPETLLEAELFGFERGAFTDARQAKAGLFQTANHGTILLDEVALLSEALQAKLLTVVEERTVRRLGSTRSEPVDLWILTASNEDLRTAIRLRRFREDLYHRLAVLTLSLPPLRERGSDILLLGEHFLARACRDYGLPPKNLTPDAHEALLAYPWPGNVRELANVMERVALLSEAARVTAKTLGLPEALRHEAREGKEEERESPFRDAWSGERARLLDALQQTDWNISRAASRLGVPRGTLRYRMKLHGLGQEGAVSPPRRRLTASEPPAREVSEKVRRVVPAAIPPLAGTRWEPQRLTLLRAVLMGPPPTDRPSEASRALQVLMEKVQSFGGRVVEAGPTGLLAAFGLEPVEDAPTRAALAATAILKARERAQAEGELIQFRIGIHSGQFLVGQIGGEHSIDLEGKRQAGIMLEALVEGAEPDTIWASEAATRFLERRFQLAPSSAPRPATGLMYRLAGRAPTSFRVAGHEATFVGRRDEIELLQNRLASALRGQGQVVGIAGEAGIGKSRLLFEFRQTFSGDPVAYLEGRCVSYGSTIPYLPVLDLVHQHCGITDADRPEAIAEKVHATLEGVGMNAKDAAPYLLHLLGVKSGAELTNRLSPELIKARTFEALRKLALAASRQRPLILGVEDLHWIDTMSEEYLGSLVHSLAGAPILLLVTYRSGYRPPWLDKSYATHVVLQSLSSSDSLTLVRSTVPGERLPDPLTQVIIEKAEGNPFFLEELARAVGEQGDSVIPDTIRAVLQARIDRLPPEGKQLLQASAVIGNDVPFALLRAIEELPHEKLQRGLADLEAAEFLYETRVVPDLEYTFKHALTHDVAYESLPQDRRRALHARIMEAIERLSPDRLAEQVERLAHHALRGEVWEKALAYFRQAGAKAFARSAHREAVACFEQALDALAHLPRSRTLLEQAVDLRLDLRQSLQSLGELGRMTDPLLEARALAEALDDQRRLGLVSAYLTVSFRQTGDYQQALESGQRALAIAARLEDFALQVPASYFLGLLYHVVGQYGRAIDFLRENVESLQGDLVGERFGMPGLPAVNSRAWLAWSLAELGQFTEGIAWGEEGIRIAEAADHPFSLASAYSRVGVLFLIKGDLHRALPVLERGLSLCQIVPLWFPRIASPLGAAYALSGRLAEALPLLEQAVERAAAMGNLDLQSLRLARLGEGYLLASRISDATTAAGRALDLARKRGERGGEAWTLRLLGKIASHPDPPDAETAESYYRQAMTLAEELGMRPLKAHCHLGLGELYSKTGSREHARVELSTALELYRSMEMTFWLNRAEAALSR